MDEESDDDDDQAARGPTTTEESSSSLEKPGTQPSQVLFVAGLPQEVTTDMLSALFQQFVFSPLSLSS